MEAAAFGSEVELELGGEATTATIYFIQMHLADVRACLLSDNDELRETI
jgi:hypothetical protein